MISNTINFIVRTSQDNSNIRVFWSFYTKAREGLKIPTRKKRSTTKTRSSRNDPNENWLSSNRCSRGKLIDATELVFCTFEEKKKGNYINSLEVWS